jgi:hypothetical protein
LKFKASAPTRKVAALLKRFCEWMLHWAQVREQKKILKAIPAPAGTRRQIIRERMPHGSHSLTQVFRGVDGIVHRQDCTIIQSSAAMRAATRTQQEA